MNPIAPLPANPTCAGKTSKGSLCRRSVSPDEKFCWQHARGIKHKWRALTRNQTIAFTLAILGGIGVVFTVLAWVYPDFWKKPSSLTDGHAELRPYVTVKEINLAGQFTAGQVVEGEVVLINSGRTPATDMVGCATIVFRPNTRPMTDDAACPETDIPGPAPKGEYSHLVIGPGIPIAIKTQHFSVQPASQALALIRAGGFHLYVYGDASYVDTLVPTVRHSLKFCGSYLPDSKTFATCEKHNSTD